MAKTLRTSRYAPRLAGGYSGTTTQTLTPADYRTATESLVLWRWNETDTSQIGTRVIPCDLNASPISSETISVTSTATSVGTRLRFQLTFSTNSVTTNAGLWPLLDDAGNAVVLPNRFIMRIRFCNITLSNVSNLYFGIGVWSGDTGSAYGVGIAQHSTGNATVIMRLQDSDAASTTRPWNAMSTTGAGATWQAANNIDHAGSAYQWKYNLRQGSGSDPFLANATYESIAGGGKSDQTPFTLVPAARSAAGQAFQTVATTIDAGWNGKTCNQPMLFFMATTGTGTKTADFEVADIEILRDPLDYP